MYENHPTQQGELAETQNSGYAAFTFSAGTSSIRMAGVSCSASISDNTDLLDASLFCDVCHSRILEITDRGYVLADLYDLENIRLYAVRADRTYTMRDYTVTITGASDTKQLDINVTA